MRRATMLPPRSLWLVPDGVEAVERREEPALAHVVALTLPASEARAVRAIDAGLPTWAPPGRCS